MKNMVQYVSKHSLRTPINQADKNRDFITSVRHSTITIIFSWFCSLCSNFILTKLRTENLFFSSFNENICEATNGRKDEAAARLTKKLRGAIADAAAVAIILL